MRENAGVVDPHPVGGGWGEVRTPRCRYAQADLRALVGIANTI